MGHVPLVWTSVRASTTSTATVGAPGKRSERRDQKASGHLVGQNPRKVLEPLCVVPTRVGVNRCPSP
jgi:hypothetical protein